MATSRWKWTVRAKTVRDTQTRQDQTPEGGSRRRGNHVKSELSHQAPLNCTFQEGSSGRRLFKDMQLLSEALDGSLGEYNEDCEQCIELGVDFVGTK